MKSYTVFWRYKAFVTGWSHYTTTSAREARRQHLHLHPEDVVRKVVKEN